MPKGVVKTAEDKKHWKEAKKKAAEEGHAEDWDYVMGIFQRMSGKKSLVKGYYVPYQYRFFRIPGQVPSKENIEIMRLANAKPKPATMARLLDNGRKVLTVNDVVSSLGLDQNKTRDLHKFIESDILPIKNEMVLRKVLLQKCQQEKYEAALQQLLLERSLALWRNKVTKSLVQIVTPDELLNKALFIGPRGGRWADPKHTIPYDPKKHGSGSKKKILVVDMTTEGKKKREEQKKKKVFVIDQTKQLTFDLDAKAEAPKPAPVPKDKKEIEKIKKITKVEPSKEEAEKLAREIGEHVWGSRKDLAAIRNSGDLDNLTPENQAKVATKKYLMPKWDPEDLYAAGVDPEAILYRKAIESCIQAKAFDNLEARKAYMDGIDYVTRSLDKCKTKQDMNDFLVDWKNLCRGKKFIKKFSKEEYPQIIDEYLASQGEAPKMDWKERKVWEKRIGDVRQSFYRNREKYEELESIIKEAKEEGYTDYSARLAVNKVLGWKAGLIGSPSLEMDSTGYRIYADDPILEKVAVSGATIKANKYGFMAATLGKRIVKTLQYSAGGGPFGTGSPKPIKDADKIGRNWIRAKLSESEKFSELIANLEGKSKKGKGQERSRFKWERNVPGEINRVGGKPVLTADPQVLADTFKFKNVQFGNWVSEEDAESHLKGAQGAFLDLSDILGIDPQTVSLNGRLSIGFGARGKGGFSAHYEPGGRIINLTKMAGGGSLAHEWSHAMDHLVSIAYNPTTKEMPMLSNGDNANVSPAVVEAMREVMQSIRYKLSSAEYNDIAAEGQVLEKRYRSGEKLDYEEQVKLRNYYKERSKLTKSDFLKDAQSFSQSADSYWTRPHELFARAFESAIEDILNEQDRVSSYLVAGTKEIYRTGRYQSDADYKNDKHAQMYPQGETRKRITTSVKKLIEALRKDKTLEKALIMLKTKERFILRKAGHKYKSKKPDGKGGWIYTYDEPKNEKTKLDIPQIIGQTNSIAGPQGKKATIKKVDRSSYIMRVPDSLRARWGNKKEIMEDIQHFKTWGTLASTEKPKQWDYPKTTEKENEKVVISYKYGVPLRPVGFATVPKGYKLESHPKFKHGVVSYSKPLSQEEIESYELEPILSKKQIEVKINSIYEDMSDYADEYIELAEDYFNNFAQTVRERFKQFGGGYVEDMTVIERGVLEKLKQKVNKSLIKADPRGGKYYRRVPKSEGKGYRYIYQPEKYNSRSDAHIDGKGATKAYLTEKIKKCVSNFGKGGCELSALRDLTKKFGSKQLGEILQDQVNQKKIKFSKGRLYSVA